MTLDVEDTIVAIASAPGGAMRGILRMSGPQIRDVLRVTFSSDADVAMAKRPQVFRGHLHLDGSQLPGELYFWPTNASYTKQPSAEFHTLGAPPLLQMGLRTICEAGARLARPGEFTLRAFLAGRLDLMQAEAVLGVIDAESQRELDKALTQLAGGLTDKLDGLRNQLLNLCADLEAGLDFVEDDISFVSLGEVADRTGAAIEVLDQLESQMSSRSVDRSLPVAVLVGRPNAGKSSLLNALAREEASLVTDQPGTTRDYVSRTLEFQGVRCEVIDTAGLEQTVNIGPQQSAQSMTKRQVDEARLIVRCIDGSAVQRLGYPCALANELIVITKSDLREHDEPPIGVILTSAKLGHGLDDLRRAIGTFFAEDAGSGSDVLDTTATRCRGSLQTSLTSLRLANKLCRDCAGEELIAAEIRLALHQLGEIVGAIYTDDILDRIFSRFCIGK